MTRSVIRITDEQALKQKSNGRVRFISVDDRKLGGKQDDRSYLRYERNEPLKEHIIMTIGSYYNESKLLINYISVYLEVTQVRRRQPVFKS